MREKSTNRRGFSMIELVIVVVIIGIIAAIAVPRLSRGSSGANDAALRGDLQALRNAIDRYAAEHGGKYPSGDVEGQLTRWTDAQGNVNHNGRTATHIYGPYLREIPKLKVGKRAGNELIDTDGYPDVAWVYDSSSGTIRANCDADEADAGGVPYKDY